MEKYNFNKQSLRSVKAGDLLRGDLVPDGLVTLICSHQVNCLRRYDNGIVLSSLPLLDFSFEEYINQPGHPRVHSDTYRVYSDGSDAVEHEVYQLLDKRLKEVNL